MRQSLTLKMFVTTLLVTTITLLLVFIGQVIYFNMFYQDQIIHSLADALNELELTENDLQEDKLGQIIKNFNNENNAFLSTSIDYFNGVLESNSMIITTLTDNNEYLDLILSEEQLKQFDTEQLLNDITFISGYYAEDDILAPTQINDIIVGTTDIIDEGYTAFSGEVKVIDIYDLSSIMTTSFYYPNDVDVQVTSGKIDDISYHITEIPFTTTQQVDLSKSISVNGLDIELWVNASLYAVDESSNALKSFLPFFIIFVFFITGIVSFIYSKSITKPIIELTTTTNAISRLDFSTQLNTTREDELGILSKSITTLSNNLDQSLQELSQANEKLTIEYENEIKQEHARKEFVANVSHEIKTPLGVIKSYSEGIRDAVKKEKRDYYVDVVLDEVANMDNLVVELLDLAKYDAGKVPFKKDTIDVEQALKKCIQNFSTSTVDKALTIELLGDFKTITGDLNQFHRVLSNLIQNAIKYSLKNTTILIEGTYKHGQSLVFTNNCEPIAEENLEKLWQRFYKVDTSHNRNEPGTGLGLSIVKSILDGHQANYHITSQDQTISFHLHFPIQKPSSD